jgi:hypothetical protein
MASSLLLLGMPMSKADANRLEARREMTLATLAE